jgi:hypothetical protein
MKNPIAATLFALLLAIAVNLYYFITGNELTTVVSRPLFADLILVLSLVPVYQAILVRNSAAAQSFPERVKSGMKPVAMFSFLIGLVTFVLIKVFGEPLIADRMVEVAANMDRGIETGTITEEIKAEQLALAAQIYSPTSHVLIVLVTNLFVGFLSSILAAVLVKK